MPAPVVNMDALVLPPGRWQCPLHAHREEQEMFPIFDDVVACPAGGPEVARQIINTGSTILRYLAGPGAGTAGNTQA